MIFSFLILFKVGCASLVESRQIVAVDSTPRGAKVSKQDKVIGNTPLFIRIERDSSLSLQTEYLSNVKNHHFSCDYRWRSQIFYNLSLAAIFPLLFPIGVAVDYYSGAAFDCPKVLRAKIDTHVNPHQRYCKRFIVAVPEKLDLKLGIELRQQWINQSMTKLRGCDDFSMGDRGRFALALYNLNRPSAASFNNLTDDERVDLGFESLATHIIKLDVKTNEEEFIVTPKVYDLLGFKEREKFTIETPTIIPKTQETKSHESTLFDLNFIPNSLTYKLSATESRLSAKTKGASLTPNQTNSSKMSIFSKIGMTSVEPPYGYSNGQWLWVLHPHIEQALIDTTYTVNHTEGNERHSAFVYDLRFMYLFGPLIHTPIGSFSWTIGGGPYLRYIELDDKFDKFYAYSIVKSEVKLTSFITKKLFLQIGLSRYHEELFREGTELHDSHLEKTYSDAFIRFGSFFPLLKQKSFSDDQ